MSSITSGSIKIPGLGNGTDFGEMIDKLEQIEMKHALQLNKWKKDWVQRKDAFEQVRTAMQDYSSALKKLNSIDKFLVKNVINSNSAVCNATATGSADNVSHTIDVKQKATNSYAAIVLNVNSNLDSINTTGTIQELEFYLGGTPPSPLNPADPKLVKVSVPPNCTLEGLKNIINQELGSPRGDAMGMRASIINMGNGKQMLQLYSTKTGEDTQITMLGGDSFWDSGDMGIKEQDGAAAWMYTKGQDALVRIDGWPTGPEADPDNWLKISNNSITHIPGVNITITGTGTTVIDVDLDTAAIEENINAFVEATNDLRKLMKELTDYNNSKQTIGSDYADSQFDTQKGGVLTGNYGMQLMMSKMKTFIFSKPEGFDYLVKDEVTGEVLSGDVFASLAHIGIKTDDEQGSPTYGLLVFENNLRMATEEGGVELITLSDALKRDPKGIAELFAADCVPTVDGHNFGYYNHLQGFTQAGNYEVSYEVAADGSVINATVNGQEAKWESATNQLTVTGEGPAKGLVLDIYNNTPTGGTPHTGTVRLKSGFIPGLINMVDSDFLDPDSGKDDTKKGTLSILISQYQAIIDNINTKITKEDERLTLWRQRMDIRFANLEATLKRYSGLQEQLEAQVNSMSSSKK